MELKDRVVVVSKNNMDSLVSLYGKCSRDEMERIVNNIINNAVAEIREDESGLHKAAYQKAAQALDCSKCEFMRQYDYSRKIYYCDHVDRIDDMGKLSASNLQRRCPEWCPLK